MVIRDATELDLPAISGIYNALIDSTTITWTEQHETLEARLAWFARQEQLGYPVLVAEDPATGDVAGFATFGDFRDAHKWPGYRFVVEHSVHVAEPYWSRGVGRRLVLALLDRAAALGKTQMIGGIDGANDASIRFHERLGFREVARLESIGFKHDTWLDLVLMQRSTS
jgi:phosphinothricin acetyltransferase